MADTKITRNEALSQGLKYYPMVKPCNRGHLSFRYSRSGLCRECVIQTGKKNYYSDVEKHKLYRREYSRNNKQKNNARARLWRNKNKEKYAEYRKIYAKRNPYIRIQKILRTRINDAINGSVKSAKTMQLIGCKINEFIIHIEKQFANKMTWENYGSVWHIDHIRPCASFDLSLEDQQRICFHFTNLRPLLKMDNLKKSSQKIFLI